MAITSRTEIANLALAYLGARRINSYASDETTEAKAVRLQFDLAVDTLLRRHQWNFATARKTLSRLTEDPPIEWDSAWQLPADFIRLIRIPSPDRDRPHNRFAIEGKTILVSALEVVQIVYVSNAVPIPEWDDLFVDALKLKLAASIAGDVTQNPDFAARATQELESLALPTAQTANAREVASGENMGPRQLAARSSLVNSRRSGFSSGYSNGTTDPEIPSTPTILAPNLDAIAEDGLP